MSKEIIDKSINKKYEYGFTTDIEQETIPPGLNEDVIRNEEVFGNAPHGTTTHSELHTFSSGQGLFHTAH